MIIRQDKTYETSSMFPNTNWYEDEDNYIIDETTDEGKQMARIYMENYPFVDFEADENMVVTNVIVLDKPEMPPEIEGKRIVLKQDENGEYYYDYEDIPLTQEQLLGQEVTNLKISNIQKDLIINQLGQEVTNIKLQLIGGEK